MTAERVAAEAHVGAAQHRILQLAGEATPIFDEVIRDFERANAKLRKEIDLLRLIVIFATVLLVAGVAAWAITAALQ